MDLLLAAYISLRTLAARAFGPLARTQWWRAGIAHVSERARARLTLAPLLLALLVGGSACDLFNPCISLAERICACEPTPSARENCRQIRIEALRNNVDITEDQLNVCQAKLETCDCDDIDENRVDQCGFVVE